MTTRKTAPHFEKYDVLQISRDSGDTWLDFSTLRDAFDFSQAIRFVEDPRSSWACQEGANAWQYRFRVVRPLQGGLVVMVREEEASGAAAGDAVTRPSVRGVRKPLALTDPIEWWQEEATRLGVSVEDLREQVRLADGVLEEIVREEALACAVADAWAHVGLFGAPSPNADEIRQWAPSLSESLDALESATRSSSLRKVKP